MSNQNECPLFKSYKMLYLVGINEAKDQILLTFRYREVNGVPALQLVHKAMGLDGNLITVFSDISIEHSAKYIQGGVPSNFGWVKDIPNFTFKRETMELKFNFDDVPMSAVIMQDTAIPFVQLISRM